MLITISGTPGSGKTTVARLLAKRLGVPHVYAGDFYRREAAARGLSLEAFNKLTEQDHSIDRQLDAEMAKVAKGGNAVLEGRLAAFLAVQEKADALKVWLTASDDVRAQRVSQREGGDKLALLHANDARQRSDAKRYREIYGFDLDDTSIYDLKLESDDQSPEALAERIFKAVQQRFRLEASPS